MHKLLQPKNIKHMKCISWDFSFPPPPARDLQEEEGCELTLPSTLIDRSLKMNVWLEKNIQIAGCLLSVWDFNDLCSFLLATPLTPNNPGTMGGLFLDGEESPALEDISKWTVEDVCSFVSSLSGCTEYTQVNPRDFPWQEQPHSQGLSGLFLVGF